MSDQILTVIGVALAVYAILPRWRQLDLQFRFRYFEWASSIVGVLTLVYLQFHPVFARLGWTPHLGLMTEWGVTTEMASSLVVLIVAIMIVLHMRSMALAPARVPRFALLVEELLQAKEYAALFTLLERYLPRLWEIAQGQNLFARARRWAMLGRGSFDHETGQYDYLRALMRISEERRAERARREAEEDDEEVVDNEDEIVLGPVAPPASPPLEVVKKEEDEDDPDDEVGRFRNFVAPKLGRLIPKQVHRQAAAREILRELFTSDGFMRELVVSRPHLIVPLLKRKEQHYEFLDLFLRLSLRTPASALYREIAATEVVEKMRDYRIEPQSELVDALLGDATFVEDHNLWQPIAQEMLAILRELRRADDDPYNESYDDWFRETGMWGMPLFITIHYFDIMVSRARAQGVRFDMWLRYMSTFVGAILENYAPAKRDYDPHAEFPTRYSWALYRIFSTLLDWSGDLYFFPQDSPHLHPKKIDASQEVKNIPKTALHTVASALRKLLLSDRVEADLKQYIADMVFHRYGKLKDEGHNDYAAVLLACLTSDDVFPPPGREYMRAALRNYDMFERMMHKELDEAILGSEETR